SALVTVLSLLPRRSVIPPQSFYDITYCLRPHTAGSTSGVLNSDEATACRDARNRWLLPLVQLALELTMRQGELLRLRWDNMDLNRRTAHLPDTSARRRRAGTNRQDCRFAQPKAAPQG
ncbi:MAG: hypothetical protein WBP89_16095, partial [Sedimenticolaceae bacterium]